MIDPSHWSKEQALSWLNHHPESKTLIEGLAKDDILRKLDRFLGRHDNVDLIQVAKSAGYRTGLDEPR